MPCIVCMIALYLLFPPPLLSSVDPAATADYTAATYDYVVDDSTPTVELPGKKCPFTSPSYRLSVYTLSIALGICCCYVAYLFNCITCFCCPLIYLSLSYAAVYIYIYIYYIQQLAMCFV